MDDQVLGRRRFVLERLAAAPDRRMKAADLNKTATAVAGKRLGLKAKTAGEVLAALAAEGHVERTKEKGGAHWRLTDGGAAYLAGLPVYRPPPPVIADVSPEVLDRQREFVLGLLYGAADRTVAAAGLKGGPAGKAVGLTAKAKLVRVLDLLAYEGDVEEQERGGKVVGWRLTPAGERHYAELASRPPHGDAERLELQRAFLLMDAFQAGADGTPAGTFGKKIVGKKAPAAVQGDGTTAAWLEKSLVADGQVQGVGSGKTARYRLTPAGVRAVAGAVRLPDVTYRLTGGRLAELLAAARESGGGVGAEVPLGSGGLGASGEGSAAAEPDAPPLGRQAPPPTARPPADLSDAILAAFQDLHRERYAQTGMVPLHEIRGRIAQRFGEAAAGHDVLDAQIKGLRAADKVRLVAIGDRSRATAEQLAASVPGVNETFFYMGEPL